MDFDDPRCLNLYSQAGKFKLPVLFDMQDTPDGYGLRDDYGLPKLEHTLNLCPETILLGMDQPLGRDLKDVPSDKRCSYPKGPIKLVVQYRA